MVKWWDVIMEGDMWALNCVFTALFIGERLSPGSWLMR